MKRIKEIRIWHEDENGKITSEYRIFLNRGQPGTKTHMLVTETLIQAGHALGELAISRNELVFTNEYKYRIEVERFNLIVEPKVYPHSILDAAQGALDYTRSGYGKIYLGMLTVTIDNLKRTIKLQIWKNAKIEMM